HQILLLGGGKTQTANVVVMRHDIRERSGASIVEIRSVLPESPKRRRPLRLVRRTHRVSRIHAGFGRRVKHSGVVVGATPTDVTGCAALIEHNQTARRACRVKGSGWR